MISRPVPSNVRSKLLPISFQVASRFFPSSFQDPSSSFFLLPFIISSFLFPSKHIPRLISSSSNILPRSLIQSLPGFLAVSSKCHFKSHVEIFIVQFNYISSSQVLIQVFTVPIRFFTHSFKKNLSASLGRS